MGYRQASLTWTAPENDGDASITDYVVEYSANGGASWSTLADGVSTNTSATVTGLEDATNYTFRVSAVNSVGTGATSATASNSTATNPEAPISLIATGDVASSSLSWTAPASNGGAEITDYVIQYSANGGTTWTTFTDGTSTSTTATVTGLNNDAVYTFRVAAVNSVGTGDWSGTTTATTPATGVPAAPANLTRTLGAWPLQFTWDSAGASVTHYSLRYRISFSINESDWIYLTGSSGYTSTSYTMTSTLMVNVSYNFQVRATNSFGTDTWSANTLVTTPNYPAAPTSVSATDVSMSSVTLSWDHNTDFTTNGGLPITSYTVQRFNNATFTWTIVGMVAPGSGTTVTFTDTNLSSFGPGQTVSYRVRSSNTIGTSMSYSNTVSVSLPS